MMRGESTVGHQLSSLHAWRQSAEAGGRRGIHLQLALDEADSQVRPDCLDTLSVYWQVVQAATSVWTLLVCLSVGSVWKAPGVCAWSSG